LSLPVTTQVVEYGNNLTGWTTVPIPSTIAGQVTITLGNPADQVTVKIPALGTKVHVRLKVVQ
ncbi:MAG: hypothetical protein JHD23_12265, partial [Akkermansiaceae bacterium]|nr:hypothetical protein [Akkermansiaceae bacterium]MBJ7425250.1 hypothetical protein [Akkermansiaceae bacterium]